MLAVAGAAWIVMASDAVGAGRISCHDASTSMGEEMSGWTLMVLAMMLPAMTPLFASVARRSYRSRRWRAVLATSGGYVLAWMLPLPLLLVVRGLSLGNAPWIATACCGLAALWTMLPFRHRWFAQCHREIPLCPVGLRADRDALRQGLVSGVPCVAGCWPLMLACAFTGHNFVVMIAGTALTLYERRQFRFAPTPILLASVGIAGLTLVV